jgi:hypothetical protein
MNRKSFVSNPVGRNRRKCGKMRAESAANVDFAENSSDDLLDDA